MAAAIAHEVKNPLAGIEVMAGVLQAPGCRDSPDAQSILNDIINEAKMANQIVHEALEFVRPIRLQVEHTSIADVLQTTRSTLAESKCPRAQHQPAAATWTRGCRRSRATSTSSASCSRTC